MRTPPPLPPEPFLPRRTPPTGTLLGLPRPGAAAAPTPTPPALPPAAGGAAAPAEAHGEALERKLDGLRLELASFRAWLPGQLAGVRPGPAAQGRELRRQALTAAAGALLALALAFASASAALSWPAYARLVTAAARLGAPSGGR